VSSHWDFGMFIFVTVVWTSPSYITDEWISDSSREVFQYIEANDHPELLNQNLLIWTTDLCAYTKSLHWFSYLPFLGSTEDSAWEQAHGRRGKAKGEDNGEVDKIKAHYMHAWKENNETH
jgi:hypothetical protein